MATKSQIQFVRALQSRKTRDELGLFLTEGPKVVDELLHAPNVQVQDVFATAAWAETHAYAVYAAGGNVIEVDDAMLHRLSSLSTANQVIAVFTKPLFPDTEGHGSGFSLVLDGIQDPGNLGTIVRCADWFGVRRIICGPGTADAFNPKVIQSTMGSITRVPVRYEADLGLVLEELTTGSAGEAYPVFAATLGGTSIFEVQPVVDGSLVIGNESRGISEALLAHTTREVTIPRRGAAESLNAAMATGIILSHLVR
jgi:TrmH family RNA methyltransferase